MYEYVCEWVNCDVNVVETRKELYKCSQSTITDIKDIKSVAVTCIFLFLRKIKFLL